jgi:hypothetical protein
MSTVRTFEVVCVSRGGVEKTLWRIPLTLDTLGLRMADSPLSKAIVGGAGLAFVPRGTIMVLLDGKLCWRKSATGRPVGSTSELSTTRPKGAAVKTVSLDRIVEKMAMREIAEYRREQDDRLAKRGRSEYLTTRHELSYAEGTAWGKGFDMALDIAADVVEAL